MQCHHGQISGKVAGDFLCRSKPSPINPASCARHHLFVTGALPAPHTPLPIVPSATALSRSAQAWDVTSGDRCRNTAVGAARPRLGATGVCRRRSSLCRVGPPGSSGRSAASHRQQTLHWQQQLVVVGGPVGGASQPGERPNASVSSGSLLCPLGVPAAHLVAGS